MLAPRFIPKDSPLKIKIAKFLYEELSFSIDEIYDEICLDYCSLVKTSRNWKRNNDSEFKELLRIPIRHRDIMLIDSAINEKGTFEDTFAIFYEKPNSINRFYFNP